MSETADFRASVNAYLVLSGPFAVLAVLSARAAMWDAFTICVAVALAFAVWLAWFRLLVGRESFTYRSPFHRPRTVPYNSVTGVNITARGPASRAALGVALQVSDGSRVLVNFKVLPRQAGALLMERIHT